MNIKEVLDFYAQPTTMTSGGKDAIRFNELPQDVGELTRMIQGLVLYEYVASDFYGFTIPDQRRCETHLRSIENMLEALFTLNDRPLSVARSIDQRLIGICHHFALLLVAMLRSKGISARYRCGFGSYFNPGYFEEHVVCEYWNATERRWVLVDPQFDAVWQEKLKIGHNILDLPRAELCLTRDACFIMAGDAWVECRTGKADPSKFGIFKGDLRGLWFIAGELVRDVAALNKMEMLPWDVWGAIPKPDEVFNEEQLVFFDQLADLTRSPDKSWVEIRALYENEDCLRVPAIVFNSVLNCSETIRLSN